jgi:bifunctional DNA-binding transcriptional regulator/antitoxin component of YhaV-PrlF toxin-antitoxin module
MAKVTSKLQVTVPVAVAEKYAIRPGDELDWIPAGDGIRVVKRVPSNDRRSEEEARTERLRQFDQATRRQGARNRTAPARSPKGGRGWTREDLYRRGGSR